MIERKRRARLIARRRGRVLTSAVIVRLLCICGMLLTVFAGFACGDGTYQRTKDGKTIVWNNDPQPGDAAAWFGDRDREGYATKVGILTWYTANGAVYARYFGNMVRGKFDGMVNVHSKGKTGHAIFIDGRRTTRWVAGRAPSFRVAQQRTEPAKPTVKIAKAENAELRKRLRASSPQPNVQPPIEEKPAEAPPSGREAEDAQRPTSNSEGVREQALQRPIEDAAAKELSQPQSPPTKPPATELPPSPEISGVAEPEAPAEGPPSGTGAQNAHSSRRSEAKEEPPQPGSESFPEQAAQSPMENIPSVEIQPAKEAAPAPPTSEKSQAEVEDSLQSPVRPPSSIYAIPETPGSPATSPRLTKWEVVKIANAEAHKHGYNPVDYQRAEPQYDAAYKIWSVLYEQRAVDEPEEAGKHFDVIVDDKTKGTVFMLRR